MSDEIKTVMVLGGNGNLGPYLVRSLSKAGFRVSILSRSSASKSTAGDEIPVVQSDYSLESLIGVFQDQDAVICAIPATNVKDQHKIIDAAVAAKVKRLLPNEFGADTSLKELADESPMFKAKQEIVTYLKDKEQDGLSWTALCTGGWIDWMLWEGKGLLGWDIKNRKGTLFDSGDRSFTATNIAKVAEATAAVLSHPGKTRNQYVHVGSFSLTQNIVRESLDRLSGSKFAVDTMSLAELSAIAKKHLEENDWDSAYYKVVTAFIYSGHKAAYFPEKAAHWNSVLELAQEETVDEMIARVLKIASES